jgi:hypothetical protein
VAVEHHVRQAKSQGCQCGGRDWLKADDVNSAADQHPPEQQLFSTGANASSQPIE